MDKFTALPLFISTLFSNIPHKFRHRHKLIFCWLIMIQAAGMTTKNTLKSLALFTPTKIAEWHFRRFLTASYWSVKIIMHWLVTQIISKLPKPEDKTIYLTVDGSHKPKRGKKNPLAQYGKIKSNQKYFLGIKFIVLMINWNNFRIPVDFEIIWPKSSKLYINENQLFRNMLQNYNPPKWVKQLFVLADAAYSSKTNFKLLNKLHEDFYSKNIDFWYVFGMAKTWKTTEGSHIKNYAKHIKHSCYKKINVKKINQNRKKSYWCFQKHVDLNNLGEVNIIFSKKRRNLGPKRTKVLVTNHPDLTAKQVIEIYQHRFLIEVLFKELKSHIGLGQHQVTSNVERIKNSFGIGFISYLLLIRVNYREMPTTGSWSIISLQNKFREKLAQDRFKRYFNREIKKLKIAA